MMASPSSFEGRHRELCEYSVVGRGREFFEGAEIVRDEGGPQHEVLGRVARDGELREGDEIRSGRPGVADGLFDQPAVPLEVAHRGVVLGQRDPDSRHAPSVPAGRSGPALAPGFGPQKSTF